MDACKLLVAAAVAAVVSLPLEAHRGPEEHPTVQELEDWATELSVAIGDVERRLTERIDGLDAPVGEWDEQAIADAVESAVAEAMSGQVQPTDGLKERVNAIIVIGAALLAGLACVSGFLGFRLMAERKRLSRSSENASQAERADPVDAAREGEKNDDQPTARRIVTHTAKTAGMQPTIKELHNPDAEWSPRTVEEAVADIRSGGIEYWARGPEGNEAKIVVGRSRSGKFHVRTEADEHEGNNLSELPDPD